jgi:dihydrofolate synthase/folylpolyglutamate synthase
MLATILTEAGYRVGLYTSPHVLQYNERIRINMQPVSDQSLIEAFIQINTAREAISLTYFEFTTLAAMQIFLQEKVEIIILEVGLGGRLDATNIFDSTVAAVVSVDMDHEAYLGNTREKIGLEKAGIFRPGKPALCADPQPPSSLIEYAQTIGAKLELSHHDFGYRQLENQWSFYHGTQHKHALPYPALRGKTQLVNASLVLAILDHLRDTVPVTIGNIKAGLLNTELMGRFQVLPGRPTVVLDVAHNPHAVKVLRTNLDQMGFYSRTYAVFGMMQDKDIKQVIQIVQDRVDHWFIAAPDIARAASTEDLIEQFRQVEVKTYQVCESIAAAYHAAYRQASENDRILIFGSFYTVAEGLHARSA